MRRQKILLTLWVVASCLICASFCIMAWRLHNRLGSSQRERRAALQARSELVQELGRRIAAAEAETRENEAQLPGKRPKLATELSDEDRFDRMISASSAQNHSPAVHAYEQRRRRRMNQERYGDLFAELDLSPDKLEQLKKLLIEKQEAYSDAAALVVAQGVSSFSPVGQGIIHRVRSEVDKDIVLLLGDHDYHRYEEYEKVTVESLSAFQGALLEANLPILSKAQQRVLATVCHDFVGRDVTPSGAPLDPGDEKATEQILERAGGVLSEEQARAFASYRREVANAREASKRFIRGR